MLRLRPFSSIYRRVGQAKHCNEYNERMRQPKITGCLYVAGIENRRVTMGRANVCTHYECEGLYYLDKDLLQVYRKVIRCDCGTVKGFDWNEESKLACELRKIGIEYSYDGNHTDWHYDEGESRMLWDEMIEHMTECFSKRFPSFYPVDKWRRDGERHIILESAFFQIAVVDNEWSAAWCLLEREDVDDVGGNRNLMRRHYHVYLEEIKRILVENWGEAIAYGGAWTHGKKYTKEDVA